MIIIDAYFIDQKERLFLTLFLDVHENNHLFDDLLKSAVQSLQQIRRLDKAFYLTTPHADEDTFKIFGKLTKILSRKYFEISIKHDNNNLGLADILVLGDKKSGKSTIVDQLIHGKLRKYKRPSLKLKIYKTVYEELDFRVMDTCCDNHVKELLKDHSLKKESLPKAVVYLVDISKKEEELKDSVVNFFKWLEILTDQYPKGEFSKIPILVLFNKVDLRANFDLEEYKQMFTPLIYKFNIHYTGVSGIESNGLKGSFQWLLKNLEISPMI